jgi:hypothetical protein
MPSDKHNKPVKRPWRLRQIRQMYIFQLSIDIYLFEVRYHRNMNFVRDGNRLKGGGRRAPPPSQARADFSIMMVCTPEIGNRHSVYTL